MFLTSLAETGGKFAEVGKGLALKQNIYSDPPSSASLDEPLAHKTHRALCKQKIQIEDWLLFNKNAMGVGTGGQGLIKTHNHTVTLREPSREYNLIFSTKTLKKLFETGNDTKIALWPAELHRRFFELSLANPRSLGMLVLRIASKWGELQNIVEPRLQGKYSKYIVVFDPGEIEIRLDAGQTVDGYVRSTAEITRCNERAHAILRVRNQGGFR